MPQYFFNAFDWDRFTQLLESPELHERLIQEREEGKGFRLSHFPTTAKAYPKALREFLSSANWYQKANNDDERKIADFLWYLFDRCKALGRKKSPFQILLKIKYSSKISENSIAAEWCDEVARGMMDLAAPDDGHEEARRHFTHFAAMPFRYPDYDPDTAAQEFRKRMIAGTDGYFHEYAIHSPEAVQKMHAWIEAIAKPFADRHEPEGHKGEILGALRDELAQCSAAGGGLYVTQDY